MSGTGDTPENGGASPEAPEPSALPSRDDEFSRLHGISGWPQELLMKARVMVCGVGALGNEVAKCLALTGVGHILLIDMDVVEPSNLTRSVLFRREDGQNGLAKAEAGKRSVEAHNLNEDGVVQAFVGNLADLGRGIFQRMDMIFCAVDSRAARLLLNRIMIETGSVWVDGGFQYLNPWGGAVSVYDGGDADVACYACSLKPGAVMKTLDEAKGLSCGLIGKQLREQGFISSTPTLASIIAGMQVQEGFRVLAKAHDLVEDDDEIAELAIGKQISVDTRGRGIQVIKKRARPDRCYEHQATVKVQEVKAFPTWKSQHTTVKQLMDDLKEALGTEQFKVLLPAPLVYRYKCLQCSHATMLSPLLSAYTFTYRQRKGHLACEQCGAKEEQLFAMGDVEELAPGQKFVSYLSDKTLHEAGIRPLEILQVIYYDPDPSVFWAEVTGDEEEWFPSRSGTASTFG